MLDPTIDRLLEGLIALKQPVRVRYYQQPFFPGDPGTAAVLWDYVGKHRK